MSEFGAPSRIRWSDVTPETVYPGIARQTLHGERQSLVRYVYQPGAVFPMHHHPEEQITVVISGRIRFDLNGDLVELGAGEAAVIPANLPHGAVVVGDEVVETFNTLSPRRTSAPGAGATSR
jgi:quercetin dioxygenase-like cupin family protein